MFLQSSIYSGFNFLSLKYLPSTTGVVPVPVVLVFCCYMVPCHREHNNEAIPSIQDSSVFVTDAAIINESGESCDNDMEE